jgi:hypothetical protein
MPLYKCECCNYSTKIKGQLARHEKSKKHRNKLIEIGMIPKETDHIIQNNQKIIQNNQKIIQNNPLIESKIIQNNHFTIKKVYKCDFCPKTFSLHSNKRRHEIHRCKENPDFIDKLIDDKNSKIKTLQKDKEKWQQEKELWQKDKEKLEKEKAELYKQVSTLLEKVGDTTNIQNNIILNNYGKEDLSHITDSLKNELLKIPYGAIPKMIEAIHFNDEKPENKNIMIPNKKENLVKIFQGDKWVYKNKSETISDLVDSKYTIIDEHYEEQNSNDHLEPQVKTTFTKFRKFYDEEDAEMVERLKKECELVLLNNR